MPMIKQEETKKSEKIKFLITPSLLAEIEKYCKWASVEDIGVFFEQAAEIVLKTDKEWKRFKKSKK